MTGYLLDRDVLGALENPRGHPNVHAWAASVPDNALYLSVISVMEARKGFDRRGASISDPAEIARLRHSEANFAELIEAFAERVLPVDVSVAAIWGQMLAQRDAHLLDTAVAAIAAVHGLVGATRNLRHFRGRGIRLIDPFAAQPFIEQPD